MDANSDGKAKATSPVEYASANKLATTGVNTIYDGDSAADVTAADGPIIIAPESMGHIPVVSEDDSIQTTTNVFRELSKALTDHRILNIIWMTTMWTRLTVTTH
jgi:hypothetical protein